MRLIDQHAHLQAERIAPDVDEVVARARAAGVERILVPGWNGWSSEAAIALVERHRWLDAAVGVHPHDAAKVDDAEWGRIARLAADARVVAVGETGLDYDRVFSPIPDQVANLRRNLALALETAKPVVLHVRSATARRDAQDALVDELRGAGFGGAAASRAFGSRPAGVIHSYSGPADFARAVLDLGLSVSISGLAFRKGEEVTAEVIPLVPVGRLLVETDSPFLSPPGAPRARNEPEWVRITAAWVADRRDATLERLGDELVRAYDALYRPPG